MVSQNKWISVLTLFHNESFGDDILLLLDNSLSNKKSYPLNEVYRYERHVLDSCLP